MLVPHVDRLGRNDRCWCGSGKKYKSCHLESASADAEEASLVAAFKSPSATLRNPHEIATILAKSDKPLLIVDEKRIEPPGVPFVFFSVVMIPARESLDVLQRIWHVGNENRAALSLSGPRLLREKRADAIALRSELTTHLERARVVRAGITYDSLRAWRAAQKWDGLRLEHSGSTIDNLEYVILQNLGVTIARELNLTGLVVMVVDRSMQNGLDPSLRGLSPNELGAVTFDIPDHAGHLMFLGSTPEEPTVGPWLRLPDLDAAEAAASTAFADFAERVRAAPLDGTMTWWVRGQPLSKL